MKINIKKGDKFSKLTILKEVEKFIQPSGQAQRGFLCICECGIKRKIRLSHLIHNRVKSCGCIKGARHGDVGKHLHNVWRGMRNRVSPNYFEKQYYYDKGITMCPTWRQYVNFKKWALLNGYNDRLEIDRKENDKGYYPSNCRFVTREENMANRDCTRKIYYNGQMIALKSILRAVGKTNHYHTIWSRIKRGWHPELAVDTPIRKGNYSKRKP